MQRYDEASSVDRIQAYRQFYRFFGYVSTVCIVIFDLVLGVSFPDLCSLMQVLAMPPLLAQLVFGWKRTCL